MTKREVALAAMAAIEEAEYTPVQIQKLLFLLDREAAELLCGPHFHFRPYHYGPFDSDVYNVLDDACVDGLTAVSSTGRYRKYSLTDAGSDEGRRVLASLSHEARDYVMRVAGYVYSKSFSELVRAIYDAYPEMRENSVFQG